MGRLKDARHCVRSLRNYVEEAMVTSVRLHIFLRGGSLQKRLVGG
jgi:hypothetical protein